MSDAGHHFHEHTFQGTNYGDDQQGKYFEIISPNAANYKSMVRPAIEQRYNYIDTFYIRTPLSLFLQHALVLSSSLTASSLAFCIKAF